MKVRDQVRIRAAERADCAELARLRALLWPEASAEEHGRELEQILTGAPASMPRAIFVAECKNLAGLSLLQNAKTWGSWDSLKLACDRMRWMRSVASGWVYRRLVRLRELPAAGNREKPPDRGGGMGA